MGGLASLATWGLRRSTMIILARMRARHTILATPLLCRSQLTETWKEPAPSTPSPTNIPLPYTSNARHSTTIRGSRRLRTVHPLYATIRVLVSFYPPYLLLTLTSLVRTRTLLGIAGTLVLHRVPFAVLIRRALWRSTYFRWGAYWTWVKISGTLLLSSVHPPQSDVSISSKTACSANMTQPKPPTNAMRFLFTVYENQRWWMGLLHTERPSWC